MCKLEVPTAISTQSIVPTRIMDRQTDGQTDKDDDNTQRAIIGPMGKNLERFSAKQKKSTNIYKAFQNLQIFSKLGKYLQISRVQGITSSTNFLKVNKLID